MYWTEDIDSNKKYEAPDDIVDIFFKLDCKTLPIDHAQALSDAVHKALPWFSEENRAGLHLIHVAESGNGWMRPEDTENEVLCLSRRTRMTIRVPKHRIDDALKLTGAQLDIDGHDLTIKEGTSKKLSIMPTMFSRYVLTEKSLDEDAFLNQIARVLRDMDIPITKIMAGKQNRMKMHTGDIFCRSLMVAELAPENAVKLQIQGIGDGRRYGCGLFVPQKGISAVNSDD